MTVKDALPLTPLKYTPCWNTLIPLFLPLSEAVLEVLYRVFSCAVVAGLMSWIDSKFFTLNGHFAFGVEPEVAWCRWIMWMRSHPNIFNGRNCPTRSDVWKETSWWRMKNLLLISQAVFQANCFLNSLIALIIFWVHCSVPGYILSSRNSIKLKNIIIIILMLELDWRAFRHTRGPGWFPLTTLTLVTGS